MHISMILSALSVAGLAAALAKPQGEPLVGKSPTWTPAPGTVTTCNDTSDKIIGFYIGPQLDTVVNDACAAMLPPCANPDRLPNTSVCIQTIDWPLDGPKSSTQAANVEDLNGNSISGWVVKFAVTPAAQPANSAGVFWTAQDCYGYFADMLQDWEAEGCHTEEGSGIGCVTVGGEESLKGTVFDVTIVPGTKV